jgi:hypothetical protein
VKQQRRKVTGEREDWSDVNLEDGKVSQAKECRQPLCDGRGKGNRFFPTASRRSTTLPNPCIEPRRGPFQISGTQNYKVRKLFCFKPLNL